MNEHNDQTGYKGVRAPKPSIEQVPVDVESDASAEEPRGFRARFTSAWKGAEHAAKHAAQEASTSEDLQNAVGFIKGLGAAAWKYAVGHPFTVSYGFIGLVLAVLILTLGLWDTIVIAVFVMVGAMIGQIRDGDNGIVNFFRRLFAGRR